MSGLNKRRRAAGRMPSLAELATRACVAADLTAPRQAEADAKQRVVAAEAALAEAKAAVAQAVAEREHAEIAARVKYVARPTEEQAAKLNAFARKLSGMGLEELASGSDPPGDPTRVFCPSGCGDAPPPAKQLRRMSCPLCEEQLGVGFVVHPEEEEEEGWAERRRRPHVQDHLGLVCVNRQCLARSTVLALAHTLRIALCVADEELYRWREEKAWHSPYPWVRCRRVSVEGGHEGEPTQHLCNSFIAVQRPPDGASPQAMRSWRKSLYACHQCVTHAKQRTLDPHKSLVACKGSSCGMVAGLLPFTLEDCLPPMDGSITRLYECAGIDCRDFTCMKCGELRGQ
eukprot:jgi/Tetstr1/428164/TSEL_018215.t1